MSLYLGNRHDRRHGLAPDDRVLRATRSQRVFFGICGLEPQGPVLRVLRVSQGFLGALLDRLEDVFEFIELIHEEGQDRLGLMEFGVFGEFMGGIQRELHDDGFF